MRIIVKILLSILVFVIAVVFQAISSGSGGLIILPGIILIFGLIGVWTYKPNKNNQEIVKEDKSDDIKLNKNL